MNCKEKKYSKCPHPRQGDSEDWPKVSLWLGLGGGQQALSHSPPCSGVTVARRGEQWLWEASPLAGLLSGPRGSSLDAQALAGLSLPPRSSGLLPSLSNMTVASARPSQKCWRCSSYQPRARAPDMGWSSLLLNFNEINLFRSTD